MLFFILSEPNGLERTAEPVSVTASFYRNELPDISALQLLDEDGRPVTIQITDRIDVPSTGPRTRPSCHCQIHFLADLPADGRKEYRLKIGEGEERSTSRDDPTKNHDASSTEHPASDLQIVDERLNVRIENEHLFVILDPTSGHIYTLKNKTAGVSYESPRTGEWKPDVFDPNRGWPQPSEWDPPPKVTFEKGPVFFEMNRTGTLGEFPEITLHTTYRLYSRAQYLWVRNLIEINADVPLACLRSHEFIFKSVQFSHLAWQRPSGRIETRPLAEMEPLNRHGDLVKLRPEIPWVAFVQPEQGHAVGRLHIRAADFNRLGRPLRLRGHSLSVVNAEAVHGLYWIRPYIYWPHHTNRDQLLTATAGSLYEEEYTIAFAAGPNTSSLCSQFHNLYRRLRNPIFAEISEQ